MGKGTELTLPRYTNGWQVHDFRCSILLINRKIHIKRNEISPHISYHSCHHKNKKRHVLVRMWRKGKTCASWWECKLVIWKSMAVSQKKKTTIWHSVSTPGYTSKGNEITVWKISVSPCLFAAFFTIVKIWRQHKCLSSDDWVKKV